MKKKVTTELIAEIKELAEHGFSNKQIHTTVNLSSSAFYDNQEIMDTIKEAHTSLRKKVSTALLETAVNGDTTSMIFLSKRLNLFQASYKTGELKTAKDALVELENLYHASISGDAPIELVNAVGKIINDFVKMYEVSVLEERVKTIEKAMRGEMNGN